MHGPVPFHEVQVASFTNSFGAPTPMFLVLFILTEHVATFHKSTVANVLEHFSQWILQHTGFDADQRRLNLCLRLGGACGGRLFSHLLNKSPQVFD